MHGKVTGRGGSSSNRRCKCALEDGAVPMILMKVVAVLGQSARITPEKRTLSVAKTICCCQVNGQKCINKSRTFNYFHSHQRPRHLAKTLTPKPKNKIECMLTTNDNDHTKEQTNTD